MRKSGIIFFIILFHLTTFTKAEDYYWVGGTGIWSDLNNWKLDNGQVPNEIPDATDNVIFNESSFFSPLDTVYILTGNPTCNNMIWTNIQDTVILEGYDNTFSFDIYGSITFHQKVRNSYGGKITMLSDEPGNTITSAGTRFQGDLVFGGNGEWILQDSLIVLHLMWWQYFDWETQTMGGSGLTLQHLNGKLDANGQTIVAGNISTVGSNERELDIENGHVYVVGNWTLNGENLIFNGDQSILFVGSSMSNLNGSEINYYDIEFSASTGMITNTAIKTKHRRIHFLGSGSVSGGQSIGAEGVFEIDTLLFSGYNYFSDIIPAYIYGSDHQIYYTRFDSVDGHFDVRDGYFHRIDFNGFYAENNNVILHSDFKGNNCIVDSCIFYHQPGSFTGQNVVNNLLFFKAGGTVRGESLSENVIDQLVFSSNGYLAGSNSVSTLNLNSGYWYKLQADSLSHPGSGQTNTFVQNIDNIEIVGDCVLGMTLLTSNYKPNQAIINYTGDPITAEYLMIGDIKNIGQSLEVSNGIDAGNNDGILFTAPLSPRTMYWVNGQGNWSNPNHWSLNSGGVGDQCPPTVLDDVIFDSGSAFDGNEDSVMVDLPQVYCNNMTWVDGFTSLIHFVSADTAGILVYNDTANIWQVDTALVGFDTCALHIHGSIELDSFLEFQYKGDIHFDSEYDSDYEIIDIKCYNNQFDFHNKTYFNGRGGKWKLKEGTKFRNVNDSVFFRMGELLIIDDTIDVLNFTSLDTLPRKLSLLENTLVIVHQWAANAWNINASPGLIGDTLFRFNADNSIIRSLGDIWAESLPYGQCHIRTFGQGLHYNNIEFGFPVFTSGTSSILKSESDCSYNLVDFYFSNSEVVGTGIIDTLNWMETSQQNFLRDNFTINFVFSYSDFNSILDFSIIDTAIFLGGGYLDGNHQIGYLEANRSFTIQTLNQIDTAVLRSNSSILGKNIFSQLVLFPNNSYVFQHESNDGFDTTFIINDFIANGNCDQPIRLESNLAGTKAKILFEAQNPTYPDFTANYASIRDLAMIPYNSNIYIAENAVDLGNNENWEFIETGDDIYYWVGGQGNWGDWQHWSNSSGGSPIETQCVPRELNSVVFDNNSFLNANDTIFAELSNIFCKNMWWKHEGTLYNPVFISNDSTKLNIYGSMMLSDNMNYLFEGTVYFDQYNEPFYEPDTIYSKGNIFLNDVCFQGESEIIILDDDMTLESSQSTILYHNAGDFHLNGNHLSVGAYHSSVQTSRNLNIENSIVTIDYNNGRAWWINGENFTLHSDNSVIINKSTGGSIITQNGDEFHYNNIVVDGIADSIFNINNNVQYNTITLNMDVSLVSGNFIADSIILNGDGSAIFQQSITNVVICNGNNVSVNDNHLIGRCQVYKPGKIIGNNNIKYCVFFDDGYFLGQNVFDTLVLYSGQVDLNNQGNWFYFQVDSTQTIMDSLYIRGNQCSNMTLSTFPPNSSKTAYIKKDSGFDVACDYLNIYNVGSISNGAVVFYAGANSNPLPNPDDPPPGWIFENAQGYIPGFMGMTERFCLNEEFVIDASNFNGDPNTQYFWQGSQYPGGNTYTINEPGTYYILVQYFEGCYVEDYINIIGDYPPIASITAGPFCEGDPITVSVSPPNGNYSYNWFNGETTSSILADMNYNGGIYVTVTDLENTCKVSPNRQIMVKPMPSPQTYLGGDEWIDFGATITLDAGPGDSWNWSANPEPPIPIENPDERLITVTGFSNPNPIEYTAYVELNGCSNEGYKLIGMYPPSTLGIPTAFTPNGDGVNDVLEILGSGFDQIDFKIFNRYGQLVFETNDPEQGWDGTYNNIKQEVDVYTYFVRVIYIDNSVVQESGNITLLR